MNYPNSFWDSSYSKRFPLKYKAAALRVIFDGLEGQNKRPDYSLGRLSLSIPSKKSDPNKTYLPSFKQNDWWGAIVSGLISEDKLTENCTTRGLTCLESGADPTLCPRNKCAVGKIFQESNNLWKYQSFNLFKDPRSESLRPLEYYFQKQLKGSPSAFYQELIINKLASVSGELVPPYSLPPLRKTLRREIAMKAFAKKCQYREACMEVRLLDEADNDIRLAIISHSFSLGQEWREYLQKEMEDFFYEEETAETLLSNYLDLVEQYHGAILITSVPRYTNSKLLYTEDTYAKPVYSRLPESYKVFDEPVVVLKNLDERLLLPGDTDPFTIVVDPKYQKAFRYEPRSIFDPLEKLELGEDPLSDTPVKTPTDVKSWAKYIDPLDAPTEKWITGGFDSFLSDKKEFLDNFYYEILDPNTCDPFALDWLAQFFGFTDNLWRDNWTVDQKRAILLNAFGWYDNQLRFESGYKTIKGEVTSKFPFISNGTRSNVLWGENPYNDKLSGTKFNSLTPYRLTSIDNEIFSEEYISPLELHSEQWEGLHSSKGTLLCLIWWLSLFVVHGHNPATEIEAFSRIIQEEINPLLFDQERNREYLSINAERVNANFDASKSREISIPVIISPAQATEISDVFSLENPLIAGITPIQDEYIVVIPISFKYSRFNPIWENLNYIKQNWLPSYVKVRAQYARPAADFLAAGDLIFEEEKVCQPWFMDNFDYLDNSNIDDCPICKKWFMDDFDFVDNAFIDECLST